MVYNTQHGQPRATFAVGDNVILFPFSEFILGDLVSVWVVMSFANGNRAIVIASAYVTGDAETATAEVQILQVPQIGLANRL